MTISTDDALRQLRHHLTSITDEESRDLLLVLAGMLATYDAAYLPQFCKDLTRHLTNLTEAFKSTLTPDEYRLFSTDGYHALTRKWKDDYIKELGYKEKYYTDKYGKL